MTPEYHRRMGGSHAGATVAARTWPSTRPRKSVSRTPMTAAWPAASATRDALRRQRRVPANVVQPAGRVVAVADKVQVWLIRARHTIRSHREALGIGADDAA